MTLEEVIKEIDRLPADQREQLKAHLRHIQGHGESTKLQKRTAGLHPKAFGPIADDFDAPLPDDFWLGETDPS